MHKSVQIFFMASMSVISIWGCNNVTKNEKNIHEGEKSQQPMPETHPADEPISREQNNSSPVDLCKCLTEPGDSKYMRDNRVACRDAISKELGVENWETVNMSEDHAVSARFDALANRCTAGGMNSNDTEMNLSGAPITDEISTTNDYVWESLNPSTETYATLSFFGDGTFRSIAYSTNGETNSENFTKVLDFSGTWAPTSGSHVDGVYKPSGYKVGWDFNDDYTTLTNNKGVEFQRVKVEH